MNDKPKKALSPSPAPSPAAGRGFSAGAASIESRRPNPSVLICY